MSPSAVFDGGVPYARGLGGRQLGHPFPQHLQDIHRRLHHVMRHAADRRMHPRAAERFGIDHLPRRTLHEIRAAQAHEACLSP